jgi:branched-chain amino acid transport system permease protein
MEEFVAFGIVGLSTAAIYAIIGSGLVLTYATTGVFNFAHGAAGMLAAFTYWQLTVGWGWPVPIALVVVLFGLAPAFGLLVEGVVMRPVQGLGETERLVMTVALLSGAIALAQWVWDPNVARPLFPFFLFDPPLHIGLATITWHQVTTIVVAVVVAVGLWVLLYRTRAGAEMRATVDDRGLVGLTGADPVRANRLAWILGTQLAAVGGILIAPAVALDAAQLSLLIVSAYTAAIFGRLRSIPLTFVGAVVVGCLESYLAGYLPQNPYLPGLRLAAPALLLFVSLLLFPHGRLRGRVRRLTRVPLPTVGGTAVFAAGIITAAVVLASTMDKTDLLTYGPIFSLGIVALSYVPLAGYAGQISLCQLSIAGIGAIVWAHLGAGGNPWAILAAVGISGVVGAIIAIPALRLSGVYLALGTAAFAVILDRWIFGLPTFHLFGVNIALFDQSSVPAAAPRLPGLDLDNPAALTVLAGVFLAVASVGVALVRRSRFGRQLIASRDSEAAYATLGGNLLWTKVAVFALSAGIAGLGGAVYGMQQRSITAIQFNFVAGLPIFLIAVIGGLGAIGGGLFTGTAYLAPLNLIIRLAPWATPIAALLPGLAGIGLGRNPDGITTGLRASFTPLGRQRLLLAVLFITLGGAWAFDLSGAINGWEFFAITLVLTLAAQALANRRARPDRPQQRDVPVEWWGIRRPWQPEDREVLDHGVTTR